MFYLFASPLAITVLLLLLLDCGAAHHAICNYKPGPLSPFKYGFHRWCIADVAKSLSGFANYRCGRDWKESYGQLMSDFNELRTGKIEIATVCGDGGWGKTIYRDFPCDEWKTWAYCFGPADETIPEEKINCFYLDRKDDCEWPNLFTIDQIPDHIDVWYQADDWILKENATLSAREAS